MTDDAVQGRAPGASTTPPPGRAARSAATPPCNTSDGPREISHLVKSCKTWFCQEELCWRQLIWPGDDYVRTVVLPGHDIVSVDKPVVWRFCTSCATRYGRPLPPRAPVEEEDGDERRGSALSDESVQERVPGHSGAVPAQPSRSPATPPPSGRATGMQVITVENAPPVPDGPAPASDAGEPRYTLAEARKVLAEQNCRDDGHDLNQQWRVDGGTVLVFCGRCGATFEPPLLPAAPPSNEVRMDVYSAGGHSSLRLTHTPTGIVAEASSGRSELEKREQAMLLLRARLLVAQLERDGNL